MKRLTEESETSSPEMAELINAVRLAIPFQPNPFSKRLVRSRMFAPALPRRSWQLRVSLVSALVGLGALAWAAAGRPPWPTLNSGPVQGDSPPLHREQPHPTPLVLKSIIVAPSSTAQANGPVTTTGETRALAGEDPARVLEAMRALRRDGNAAQARKLLDAYLKGHPNGALAEDALALSIEAALAKGDPRANTLAQRYLAQYPKGRFVRLAQRVVDGKGGTR